MEEKEEKEVAAEQEDKKEKQKAEKRERKERLREIKKILLGKYAQLDDGRLCASGSGWVTSQGLNDGASTTIIFGVKEKRFLYRSKLKNSTQAVFKATAAMRDIGRALYLETAPEGCACYVRSILFRPVVLRFCPRGDSGQELALYAYCGRSPLAFLSVRRVVSRFDKALPDEIKRV